MIAALSRHALRRELIPARARWWMAAAGMRDWYGFLARSFRPHLGEGSRGAVSRAARSTARRRYDALRSGAPHLPDAAEEPRAADLAVAALYRLYAAPKAAWILGDGAPRGPVDWARATRLVRHLPAEDRWREVTVHLGELLIVLTEDLPRELPHARKILGDVCYEAGVRYARRMKRAWRLPERPENAPATAIEVLRTSEYLFRVNPEHWSRTDATARTGILEGTACPWYERPGWNGAHCGIFGQFQAGVASEFGLRYILGKTIPKHGGTTCRIDLKPLPSSRLVRRTASP